MRLSEHLNRPGRSRALLALLLAGVIACSPAPPDEAAEEPGRGLSVAGALGAADTSSLEGFTKALGPRTLVFPQDHGPHPDFQTEWWYWIGNLETDDGRRFGYQLTFFRSALAPPPPADPPGPSASTESSQAQPQVGTSDWATRQLYMAHFAVTQVDSDDGESFRSFERFSRGAAGLAGASAEPFRVWLDDWSVRAAGTDGAWRLDAAESGLAIELTLEPGKPRVLHGDQGFSRKGEGVGAASYYYSRSRMPTRGRLILGEDVLEVRGSSWFDREWSTSLLAAEEVGWDWVGAQLDDGRELMFFRLRRRDSSSARVDGTLIEANGTSRLLRTQGFEIVPRGTWTSPETGVSYPASFRLELPEEELSLEIVPVLPEQEFRHTFVYWEGAVDISGSATGRGYLEMTGYGEHASPR